MKIYVPYLLSLNLLFMWSCAQQKATEVRLNHIQVIGSHNSYKQRIEPQLMSMLLATDSAALGLDYEHLSIREQLLLPPYPGRQRHPGTARPGTAGT